MEQLWFPENEYIACCLLIPLHFVTDSCLKRECILTPSLCSSSTTTVDIAIAVRLKIYCRPPEQN